MRVALRCLLFVALISCSLAPLAHAQPTEYWNRRAAALDLAPSSAGPGLWDVTALTDLVARNTSLVRDLSTTVEILVNGTTVAGPLTVDIQLNGSTGDCVTGCGSNCGSLYIDGALNTMLCREEGPGSCDCGYWITSSFPGIPAQTGDEIMVLLRAAPGAVPDTDTSDDQLMVTLGNKPIGWNRRVVEIQVQPSRAGGTKDSFFDVFPLIELEGSGFSAYMDMSMEVELLVNSTQTAHPVILDPAMDVTPWDCEDQCGSNCGGLYFDGAINTMTCHKDGLISPGVYDCDCGYWIQAPPFPGVELLSGDEIMVLLRPAPGALPEHEPAGD